MKRTALVILCFLFLSALKAQDSLYRAQFGIEASFAHPRYVAYSLSPALVCTFGRHTVFAGPGIYYVWADQPAPFIGLQGGYQFSLLHAGEKIRLFAGYDLNTIKGDYYSTYTPGSTGLIDGVSSRTVSLVSVANYFSIGLSMSTRRVYFKLATGLGFEFYKENYAYHFRNGKDLSATGPLTYRSPFGLNVIGKLTLGVRLFRIHKNSKH